jgi:hypothetical protein
LRISGKELEKGKDLEKPKVWGERAGESGRFVCDTPMHGTSQPNWMKRDAIGMKRDQTRIERDLLPAVPGIHTDALRRRQSAPFGHDERGEGFHERLVSK